MNKKQIIITFATLLAIVGLIAVFQEQSIGTQLFKKHIKQHQNHDLSLKTKKEINNNTVLDDTTSVFSLEEIKDMQENRDTEFKHVCHHDKIVQQEKIEMEKNAQLMETIAKLPKFEHKEESDWRPIRFHVDYQNLEGKGIPQNDIDFIKQKVIPAVKAYFETTFRVHRLTTPIIPSQQYTRYGQKCGETPIPESLYDGVDGADMIMLINSQYASNENYLAYASKCGQGENELSSGRPTIGRFMVNSYYLEKDLNSKRWFTWVETGIHEMMHAMGFSSGQFKNFLNGNGKVAYDSSGASYFAGPNAVAYGKQYFECDSFNYLPLENDGGSGSAGSHWERTTFGNEGMTASDFGDAVYSLFTLNLFKDSGWYTFNESNAQELVWGKGAGCRTMSGKCDTSIPLHQCYDGQKGCSFDYTAPGYCNTSGTFQSCPFYQQYSNTVCNDPKTNSQASQYVNLGGAVGDGSRCWNIKSQNVYTSATDGCYTSKCVSGVLQVQISGSWQTCQYEGDVVSYNGISLTCPNFESFCAVESDCPNSCTAQGTCKNGSCQCYNGFSGPSCGNKGSSSGSSNAGSGSSSSGASDSGSGVDESKYCATDRGDFLYYYQQNQQYYCCNNTTENKCCGLFQTPYQGTCYCRRGYSYNSYSGYCEPQ